MKKFFHIAALAMMAVACNIAELDPAQGGEEPAPVAKMIVETVSGTRETSTKATIANDGSFAWSKDDNIAVHVSNGSSHLYVFTSDSEHGASGASVAAHSASFTVAYEEGYSRDAFAVYPSNIVSANAANYGQEGHTLDLTLPSSYTLAQVSGTTTPCPMIADNTGSGWTFHQLCGLLRLKVNSIPPSTKRLEIDFDGQKVWGDFSVAVDVTPGTYAIATEADEAHDVISITKDGTDVTLNKGAWLDGLTLNIPLPTGTYTNIKITAFNALTGGDTTLTMTRPLAYTATCSRGTKRTASFPVFSINGSYEDHPPVSSQTRRVIFAPGNLQATTTDSSAHWTWAFADHQYDFIGTTGANTKINGNGTVSENGTVDLFGRSVADNNYNNNYGISNSTVKTDYNGTFRDWGTIRTFSHKGVSTTYPAGYWFTLTGYNDTKNASNQWSRIMQYRTSGATVNGVSNARYALARINTDNEGNGGVNGIILFPDYYDDATPNGVHWGTINAHKDVSGWGGTWCTPEGWSALESAGCVFLPAAGKRNGKSVSWDYSFYAVNNLNGDWGWYVMRFKSTTGYNIYWNGAQNVYLGSSVRLVHEVK